MGIRITEVGLTTEEIQELGSAIAENLVNVIDDEEEKTDEFFMYRLSSGRFVSGKYFWNSEDFISLEVDEAE